MSQPIYSPDGNFIWDGAQWTPVSQVVAPTSTIQPKIQPISSGILNVEPPSDIQSLGMWFGIVLGGNKCFGKTRIEITGINQSLQGLIQLFKGGILTSISDDMLQTNTTENSLFFVETGKMTTTHLDVFFHDASSTSISGNITKITLEMYVRSKFDQEGRAFKLHGIKEPPQAPIKLAKWAGSKKLAKLEADLLEILSSG